MPPLTQLRWNPGKGNVLAVSSRSSKRATTKIQLSGRVPKDWIEAKLSASESAESIVVRL